MANMMILGEIEPSASSSCLLPDCLGMRTGRVHEMVSRALTSTARVAHPNLTSKPSLPCRAGLSFSVSGSPVLTWCRRGPLAAVAKEELWTAPRPSVYSTWLELMQPLLESVASAPLRRLWARLATRFAIEFQDHFGDGAELALLQPVAPVLEPLSPVDDYSSLTWFAQTWLWPSVPLGANTACLG